MVYLYGEIGFPLVALTVLRGLFVVFYYSALK